MLGVVLMVVIGSFTALWGLLHFTDRVIQRGHTVPGVPARERRSPRAYR
jgi:hypothetical protein